MAAECSKILKYLFDISAEFGEFIDFLNTCLSDKQKKVLINRHIIVKMNFLWTLKQIILFSLRP